MRQVGRNMTGLNRRGSAAWVAITVSVSVLVTSAAMSEPAVGIAGVAVVGALIAFALAPRGTAVVFVLLAAFAGSLAQITQVQVLDYLDEVAIIGLVACGIFAVARYGWRFRWPPGMSWLFAFLLIATWSAFVHGVSPELVLQGLFLAGRGMLVYWAVSQFRLSRADVRLVIRLLGAVAGVVLVTAVINFLVPSMWNSLFHRSVSYRGSIPSLIGPLTHPLAFGTFSVTLGVVAAAYVLFRSRSRVPLIFFVGFVTTTVLTLRRSSIAALLLVTGYLAVRRNSAWWVVIALGSTVAGLMLVDELVGLFEWTWSAYDLAQNQAARTVLTVGSFDVANRYFPLGAGLSRFGSYLAGVNYSPLYVELGYTNVWGLSEQTGNATFLYDTMWPAIIGEGGWLGFAFFVAGMIVIWRRALRPTGDPEFGWLVYAGQGVFLATLIASSAVPVFYTTPFLVVFFAMMGLSFALQDIDEQAFFGAQISAHRAPRISAR